MLKVERKNYILKLLSIQSFISLEQLVADLQSSESTIRRDLDELEQEGKLVRVHGGAEIANNLQKELTVNEKSKQFVLQKQKIAQKALDFILPGDVVFIDAGTTTAFLVDHLNSKQITVVTNSILHATQLVDKGIETYVLGGKIKATTQAIIGAQAIEQMNQFTFDKAFIGTNGITMEGVYTPDIEEATIKRIAIDHAKTPYVLADSSKIGQKSFMRFKPLEKFSLITNKDTQVDLKKIEERINVILE